MKRFVRWVQDTASNNLKKIDLLVENHGSTIEMIWRMIIVGIFSGIIWLLLKLFPSSVQYIDFDEE